MSHDAVWMTAAARQRLQDELTELVGKGREDDTSARTRITELRALIERAVVREMPDDGLVEPGMMITVNFEDDKSTLTFILGDRTMLNLDPSLDQPVYSPTSPMGSAITGLSVGDKAVVTAPMGERRLTITAARPVS